jgi:hypothetical protein
MLAPRWAAAGEVLGMRVAVMVVLVTLVFCGTVGTAQARIAVRHTLPHTTGPERLA